MDPRAAFLNILSALRADATDWSSLSESERATERREAERQARWSATDLVEWIYKGGARPETSLDERDALRGLAYYVDSNRTRDAIGEALYLVTPR